MSQAPRTTREKSSVDRYLAGWHATMKLLREGKSFSGHEKNCVFLNCASPRFANGSFVTGLDFPDDGRSLVTVDWDHDGDLDLWLGNRTAPRLRFMRNMTADTGPARSIMFRLQGTRCNRDAIGARVELIIPGSTVPLLRTLYAGDAYLSQSSKWLHFGLAESAAPGEVTVRWPGGVRERFTLPPAEMGTRYLLTEGTGIARPAQHRSVTLKLNAEPQPVLDNPASRRTVLSSRPPRPLLEYMSWEGSGPTSLDVTPNRPLLLTLWSHSCPTCLHELTQFSQSEHGLQNQVDVVALTVDGLNDHDATGVGAARQFLDKVQYPFASGIATAELIDKLAILLRVSLNQPPPLAVPLNFLFDGEGNLAVIYRRTCEPDRLLSDISILSADRAARRELAVPFPGRWMVPPRNLLLRPVAQVFREHGHHDDYDRLLKLELSRISAQRAATQSDDERGQLDRQIARQYFDLARSLQLQGQAETAVEYYRQGLVVTPQATAARIYLAQMLIERNELADAEAELKYILEAEPAHTDAQLQLAKLFRIQKQFDTSANILQKLLEQHPTLAQAQLDLGLTWAMSGDFDRAIEQFRQSATTHPEQIEGWINLGSLLAHGAQYAEARTAWERAVAIGPEHFDARMGLAGVLAAVKDLDGALTQLMRANELRPHSAQPHLGLADVRLRKGEPIAAATHWEAALRLDPSDGRTALRLAWLRATSPVSEARNGKQALSLATQLNKLSGGRDPVILDTLAAAQAEVGDFTAAVATATRALTSIDNPRAALKPDVEMHLNTYRSGKPFRDVKENR